ncbi:MAG: hypothetical protein ACYCSF_12715 [Acidimicrobiales bacterium]
MSYDPAFDDPWLKWRWAVQNSKAFHAEVERFLKDESDSLRPPFTTAQKYHPEFHGFSVYVDSMCPTPDWWGLWLGDIFHAYRSCLDHLAWVLVDRGTTPISGLTDEERKRIYFPCALSRDWFNNSLRTRLPGCRRADIAKVRATQPYHTRQRHRSTHTLVVLDSLSNTEKHRTIQPVRRHQLTGAYEVTAAVDCVIRRIRIMPSVPLEIGTEIARVYAKRTGDQPDIEMKGHMAAAIGLQEGQAIAPFLNEVQQFVANLLVSFGDPPPDIVKRVEIPSH